MLTHNTLTCYREGCYATITLHPDDEARLRRTHEMFYCPAGHGQCFKGKTPQEGRIADLEAEIETWRQDYHDLLSERAERTERLVRIAKAVQTCPLGCGWQGKRLLQRFTAAHDGAFLDRIGADLADHMAREHDLEVKVVDGRLVAPDWTPFDA